MDNIPLALTFDDVLLAPGASDCLPHEVDTTSQFTRGISLKTPFLSAAMDTVTEAALAIAMARLGGIGVLHRSMTPQDQAEQVRTVKSAESTVIDKPVTIPYTATVGEARNLLMAKGVTGGPVVNESGVLVGMFTNRDQRVAKDDSVSVGDVMTKDAIVSADSPVSHGEAEKIMHAHRIEKLPVVKDGKLAGLITLRDVRMQSKYPSANKDADGHLYAAAAVGTDTTVDERVALMVEAGLDVVIVDTAHGHSKRVLDTIKRIRKTYPNLQIVAGNIATAEAALDLIKIDVDALKVGVGPGSICTTRVVAGIGVPQLTAVNQVARAAKPAGIPVIADGGIKLSGDIVKALAAGAHSVMIGSLFAGTKESPGEKVFSNGQPYKMYRGMGSVGAMKKGSRDRYSQDNLDADAFDLEKKVVPEGIEGRVPYRGSLDDTIYQLLGGLRAGMGYVGAANVEELHAKAQFVRITTAGLRESHPHDITITQQSPNYPG